MSAVATVFRRDGVVAPTGPRRVGASASQEELDAELHHLLEPMAHRGPDGLDTAGDGTVRLGHLHFWTTPEARGERQPLSSPDGAWWLTVDGRLDNRDEIWRALGGAPGPLATLSDVRLMLAAFERWGRACLPRFLGPFALVAWDRRRRELTLARDAMGSRGLSCFISDSLVVAASEEQAVAAHPAVGFELDRVRTALFFSLERLTTSRTFFEGVRHVAPGEAVVISPERVERSVFWSFDPAARPAEEVGSWEERFRETFSEAVACRLRGGDPPAALVSGGLDSSPMAAVAARRLGAGRPLRAISWIFDRNPSCDEREYLTELYRELPLEAVQVACDDAWPLRDPATWPVHPATPEQNPYRLFHERAYAAAGSRVLLLGIGGDQLYLGSDGFLLDLLRAGRWRSAAKEGLWHLRAGRRYRRWMLRGLVPAGLRRSLRRGEPRPWLTSEARDLLGEAAERPIDGRGARRPAQWRSLLDPMNGHGCSVEAYYGNRHGLETRYPFRDRRLVELMLHVPTAELYSEGLDRVVLRRAMADTVPHKVLHRRSKASFEPVLRRGLFEEASDAVAEILDGAGRSWQEMVDPVFLASCRRGEGAGELEILVLWQCICLELWSSRVSWGGLGRSGRPIAGQPSKQRFATYSAAV